MIKTITPTGAPEPVAISQAVNALIVALAAAGWFTIDSELVSGGITALGGVLVIVNVLRTRRLVTAERP